MRTRRQPGAPQASSPLRAARTPLESRTTRKVTPAGATDAIDPVAAEVPVALVYHGRAHAVMMATPADLEDFARGFTLAEGIVAGPEEIGAVSVADMGLGYEVEVEVPAAAARLLEARRRGVVGGTACGLCGVLGLEQAMRPLPACPAELQVAPEAVARAYAELPALQPLHQRTGGMHAAALATAEGAVVLVREDVGRHNALDKLIGAAAAVGLEPRAHLLALTSRCSAEMVQKAAHAGIGAIAAISAPTTLAIDLAARSGQTLLAFARGQGFTIYAHPHRIRRP